MTTSAQRIASNACAVIAARAPGPSPTTKIRPRLLMRSPTGARSRFVSFPSSAWERGVAKLCFASGYCREAELPDLHSQAELGNEGLDDIRSRFQPFLEPRQHLFAHFRCISMPKVGIQHIAELILYPRRFV